MTQVKIAKIVNLSKKRSIKEKFEKQGKNEKTKKMQKSCKKEEKGQKNCGKTR